MPGRMELDFQFTQPQAKPVYKDVREGPLRILVLGDFSGRANRGSLEHSGALAERPLVSVDVDNFDDVLFRFGPRLAVALGHAEVATATVELKCLDDFHPDALYRRLAIFQAFREMRERVSDPATFAQEAQELQRLMSQDEAGKPDAQAPAGQRPEDDEATLTRLLGRSPADKPQARTADEGRPVDLSQFIKGLIQPHVVPDVAPQQGQLIGSIDEATSVQMRALLHDPAFQALESAWRGVHWLVSELDLGEEVQLFLLDVSKQELAADLAAGRDNLGETGVYRCVVESAVQTAGGQPWSLLVGLYEFGMTAQDLGLLAGLGTVGSRAGGPFLAGADPGIFGCRRLVDAPRPTDWTERNADGEVWWQALRGSGVASWIGLASPRVLLRLPYGSENDPTEAFDFGELTGSADHEGLLWGNPAVACAMLIGAAFQERGWSMRPGDLLEIGDLPAFTYREDGESRLKPCAEVLLAEPAARAMLERGVMPLMSHSNLATLRLMRFQSIADPPAALSGPWR